MTPKWPASAMHHNPQLAPLPQLRAFQEYQAPRQADNTPTTSYCSVQIGILLDCLGVYGTASLSEAACTISYDEVSGYVGNERQHARAHSVHMPWAYPPHIAHPLAALCSWC